jgi:hypothetical protein
LSLKGGRAKTFILVPQKLVVENWTVETRTSRISNITVTGKTGHSGLGNQIVLFFLV